MFSLIVVLLWVMQDLFPALEQGMDLEFQGLVQYSPRLSWGTLTLEVTQGFQGPGLVVQGW